MPIHPPPQSQSPDNFISMPGKVTTSPSGRKSYFTTPNPFEQRFGYHRAVRRGGLIFVSGTTALKDFSVSSDSSTSTSTSPPGPASASNESKVHAPTSARQQALIAMRQCVDAVEKLGGRKEDVVRVKMFVSRHEDCLDVGEAYQECFGGGDRESGKDKEVGAAATMIVVHNGFVDPDILVEVEVDAVMV